MSIRETEVTEALSPIVVNLVTSGKKREFEERVFTRAELRQLFGIDRAHSRRGWRFGNLHHFFPRVLIVFSITETAVRNVLGFSLSLSRKFVIAARSRSWVISLQLSSNVPGSEAYP